MFCSLFLFSSLTSSPCCCSAHQHWWEYNFITFWAERNLEFGVQECRDTPLNSNWWNGLMFFKLWIFIFGVCIRIIFLKLILQLKNIYFKTAEKNKQLTHSCWSAVLAAPVKGRSNFPLLSLSSVPVDWAREGCCLGAVCEGSVQYTVGFHIFCDSASTWIGNAAAVSVSASLWVTMSLSKLERVSEIAPSHSRVFVLYFPGVARRFQPSKTAFWLWE